MLQLAGDSFGFYVGAGFASGTFFRDEPPQSSPPLPESSFALAIAHAHRSLGFDQ